MAVDFGPVLCYNDFQVKSRRKSGLSEGYNYENILLSGVASVYRNKEADTYFSHSQLYCTLLKIAAAPGEDVHTAQQHFHAGYCDSRLFSALPKKLSL